MHYDLEMWWWKIRNPLTIRCRTPPNFSTFFRISTYFFFFMTVLTTHYLEWFNHYLQLMMQVLQNSSCTGTLLPDPVNFPPFFNLIFVHNFYLGVYMYWHSTYHWKVQWWNFQHLVPLHYHQTQRKFCLFMISSFNCNLGTKYIGK